MLMRTRFGAGQPAPANRTAPKQPSAAQKWMHLTTRNRTRRRPWHDRSRLHPRHVSLPQRILQRHPFIRSRGVVRKLICLSFPALRPSWLESIDGAPTPAFREVFLTREDVLLGVLMRGTSWPHRVLPIAAATAVTQ
jgi:hypothetical protein